MVIRPGINTEFKSRRDILFIFLPFCEIQETPANAGVLTYIPFWVNDLRKEPPTIKPKLTITLHYLSLRPCGAESLQH